MKDGPDISRVASLIGDPARANILAALMDGRALTATELSMAAGVGKSTTSIHLGKLDQGGLVKPSKQGRHRYYALADAEVAKVLEALMGLAQQTGATRVRTGPRDADLRYARICYDHLAGAIGVALFDALVSRKALIAGEDDVLLTPSGAEALSDFGIDVKDLAANRRKMCRGCLDWSMRRNHLAGSLGAALWSRFEDLGWAARDKNSRVVRFSSKGLAGLRETFGLQPRIP